MPRCRVNSVTRRRTLWHDTHEPSGMKPTRLHLSWAANLSELSGSVHPVVAWNASNISSDISSNISSIILEACIKLQWRLWYPSQCPNHSNTFPSPSSPSVNWKREDKIRIGFSSRLRSSLLFGKRFADFMLFFPPALPRFKFWSFRCFAWSDEIYLGADPDN